MGALHNAVEWRKQRLIRELRKYDPAKIFNPSLELMTLSEIEKYYQEIHHKQEIGKS